MEGARCLPARGRPVARANNLRERNTGMHCGVMVTGYNQDDWELLLREGYTREPCRCVRGG